MVLLTNFSLEAGTEVTKPEPPKWGSPEPLPPKWGGSEPLLPKWYFATLKNIFLNASLRLFGGKV